MEKREINADYVRWRAKYKPVEDEILAAHARREELRAARLERRRMAAADAFGDFCEASDGQALFWREEGFTSGRMNLYIATDPFLRATAARYFDLPEDELPQFPRLTEVISAVIFLSLLVSFNFGAITACCALRTLVALTASAVDHMKHRVVRPLYYEQETSRRQALARDRRRLAKRTTTNPCPTKEAILEAYLHRKDSKEAALRFGSLLHDLECFVDNSLRFAGGRISGRAEGIKGWIETNIPALSYKYTTIMRYKAMAKKVKQLVDLPDPHPAEAVLPSPGQKAPEVSLVRATALFRELSAGVAGATQLMEKVDRFLDPACVTEATVLSVWREKYKNEITVRTKTRWWRRLGKTGSSFSSGSQKGKNERRKNDARPE
jgi:hypothetical protein